jgi:sulfate permease, SulP family
MLWNIFPPLTWIRGYSLKYLQKDAIAGVTLAAYAIPVSMAYASLAGLPVQYGIYGYLVGGLFYALFGTGMQLAIGPTSAISLIIGSTVATMANGDPGRYAEIASLTALLVAAMSVLAYILRLNTIVNFISESVLLGFKAGAALTIALTQLPKLFGLDGGGSTFFERTAALLGQLPQTNLPVFFFGLSGILLLILGAKFLPGRPMAIVLVAVSVILLSVTSLANYGFSLTGHITPGLPSFGIPSAGNENIENIIHLAFACFLLAYIESISAARTLAEQGGYEINPRQELLGLSAANAALAFTHGYPVCGGLSQSVVNSKAGARTPLSLLFASLAIGLVLLFLTGLMGNLPAVTLAAILIVSITGLFDIKGLRHLWKVSKMEFSVAMIALAGVLFLGILKGVVIAAITSVILLLRSVARPHVAFLGRIPGTKRFSDIRRHPDNELIPGYLLIRVEASLFYFNIDNIRNAIMTEIQRQGDSLKCVVWDFSTSPYVDITGARFIKRLYLELKEKGISFRIAEAHSSVRDLMRAEDLEHLLGHISRKTSVDDLVKDPGPIDPAL